MVKKGDNVIVMATRVSPEKAEEILLQVPVSIGLK
jgi:hypothetical protein